MDTSGWSLILGYIFALIGFVFWLTEAKWAQPQLSRLKKTIIIIGAVLWGSGMAALAVVDYKIIPRHEAAPRLAFYLNSLPIKNNTFITIPTTNASLNLEFSVSNRGEAAAEGLQLRACFPKALNVIPSGTWHEGRGIDISPTDGLKQTDDRSFLISADVPALIGTSDVVTFVPLTLQCSNLHNTVNYLRLTADAKHNVTSDIRFTLHLTNGVGKPYIGF